NWNGGLPPFGYRIVHEIIEPGDEGTGGKRKRRYRAKLVPDEATAPIVQELFRRYATGKESLLSLCRWLDGLKIPPPRSTGPGKQWQRSVLQRILSHEVYLGDLLYGRERKGKFFCQVDQEPTARVEANGTPVVPSRKPNNHIGLTDPETFATVQRLLERNQRR